MNKICLPVAEEMKFSPNHGDGVKFGQPAGILGWVHRPCGGGGGGGRFSGSFHGGSLVGVSGGVDGWNGGWFRARFTSWKLKKKKKRWFREFVEESYIFK